MFLVLINQEKQANHTSRMKDKASTIEGVPNPFYLNKVQDDGMRLALFAAMGRIVVAKIKVVFGIALGDRIVYNSEKCILRKRMATVVSVEN